MDFVHAIISFTAALAVSLSRHTLNIYLPIYTYHSHIEVIIPQIFPLSHPYSPPLLPLHILAQSNGIKSRGGDAKKLNKKEQEVECR